MANVNIKEVDGGEVATIGENDGIEIDTGTQSQWVPWSVVKSLLAAAVQTLTNKTLTSPVLTTPQINDTSTDHQYIVAVSELAADRTVTLPLLTGADEFVFKDHTQTLTNKTLTSPTLNTPTVTTPTITGAKWDGWALDANTWTYSSADSPTFIISVNADMTALIGVGDRIKLTQTTAKYFIVTAVGAFGGGATLITVYGGTDYTLANAAITSPYYSHMKYPFGFPASPAKWTVTATDTGNANKNTPTQNTWYGGAGLSATGISISVPIGVWKPQLKALCEIVTPATASAYGVRATFSSANNSESDATFTWQFINNQTAVAGTYRATYSLPEFTLEIAAKTTYYINILTGQASVTSIAVRGDVATTVIKLVCAYL